LIPQSPGYIFISIGDFTITWYGLCIVIAAAAGLFVLAQKTKHDKKFSESVLDIALWSIISGFIGARLYHVWNEWWWYQNHLSDIVKIWDGGLALHGGILFGFLTLVVFSRIKKIPLLALTDIAAPAFLIGQIIGRFGNYFNEELFGKPTNLPWALHISAAARPQEYFASQTFHPLFLYEIALNALLFLVLYNMLISTKKRGILTAAYFIGYGAIRFSLDFLRIDQFGFGPFTLAQWVSLCLIFIGGVLLYYQRFRHRKV